MKGNKATGKKENTPADSPSLRVQQTANQTDDYTITFGQGIYFYTKGDAPKTFSPDDVWSVRAETTQDNTNQLQITVLKNGITVFSTLYE